MCDLHSAKWSRGKEPRSGLQDWLAAKGEGGSGSRRTGWDTWDNLGFQEEAKLKEEKERGSGG